jgi:uncharacterized protein (DUF697 family)
MELSEMISIALEKALCERGHVNVLIAGKTGVGKSTLINTVFQGDFATTGQGRPVTQDTREITKEGIPLTILDTRGLELEKFSETLGALRKLIQERHNDKDANRHIHVAWICLAEDSRRVEESESALANMLCEVVPTVSVITKCRNDAGFRQDVQRLMPGVRNVVRVRALQEQLDDGHVLPSTGMEELIDLTLELVPDGHKRAFVAAQKADLKQKRKHAQLAIKVAAAAALTAGATPVPFTDAVFLVPIQTLMLAKITTTYGMPMSETFLFTLIGTVGGGGAATLVGRTLVGNILKLIPGGGTLVGGAISAATAAAVTVALGEAYTSTLNTVFERNLGKLPTTDEVLEEFKLKFTSSE